VFYLVFERNLKLFQIYNIINYCFRVFLVGEGLVVDWRGVRYVHVDRSLSLSTLLGVAHFTTSLNRYKRMT